MRSLGLFSFALSALCVVGCADSHGVPQGDASLLPRDGSIFLPDAPLPDAGNRSCPADFNPWDPNATCSVEGAHCESGGTDVCSSFISCDCRAGRWQCAVAEADPVCWCGRQPNVGDRCSTEGMSCGECCPTPGSWGALVCVDGHWAASACPPVVCPAILEECPVDTASVLGTSCSSEGQQCGDSCCGTPIVCQGGAWRPGPIADCATCNQYACGEGFCRGDQFCGSRCGPTDGIDHYCARSSDGCNDCGCLVLDANQSCTMVDGHPVVAELGFCG